MKKINLEEMRKKLELLSSVLFEIVLDNPEREDDKVRTGIQVVIEEPGTRNLLFITVEQPSDAAKIFATEKAVRAYTLGHQTSRQSRDPEAMRFAGAVSYDGIFASVSGLKEDEDELVATVLLSRIFKVSSEDIINSFARNLSDASILSMKEVSGKIEENLE